VSSESVPEQAPRLTEPAPGNPPPAHSTALWRHPALWIAVAAAVLAGLQWLEARSRLTDLQEELARRLVDSDTAAKEGRMLARQNQDQLQSLQAKVGALDAKVAEFQSQQAALDAIYQELIRHRDDRLLAEVEHAATLAAQQLQLAGNVESALIGLQNADARLARADVAQFLPIRKALTRDIERLKSLPSLDTTGMALKLEAVVGAVDTLPLAFEAKPRSDAGRAAQSGADEDGFWFSLARELWLEMKQLVRIERLDRPDPALLAPENAFFLRENLKLRLVNARLALLQRDTQVFREDLKQAYGWIERYFDAKSKPVQSAIATLKLLAAAEVHPDLPTLVETLTALQTAKASRERAGVAAR